MNDEDTINPTTLLSDDELGLLAETMGSKYAHFLNGRIFTLRNWAADGGVYVSVTLANADESFYYPVEARIKHLEEEMSERKAALFLFDFIDVYFDEFLSDDEDLFIPIDWTDYDYEATDFQLRGQVINRKAEALAEKILAEGVPYTGPNIVY